MASNVRIDTLASCYAELLHFIREAFDMAPGDNSFLSIRVAEKLIALIPKIKSEHIKGQLKTGLGWKEVEMEISDSVMKLLISRRISMEKGEI